MAMAISMLILLLVGGSAPLPAETTWFAPVAAVDDEGELTIVVWRDEDALRSRIEHARGTGKDTWEIEGFWVKTASLLSAGRPDAVVLSGNTESSWVTRAYDTERRELLWSTEWLDSSLRAPTFTATSPNGNWLVGVRGEKLWLYSGSIPETVPRFVAAVSPDPEASDDEVLWASVTGGAETPRAVLHWQDRVDVVDLKTGEKRALGVPDRCPGVGRVEMMKGRAWAECQPIKPEPPRGGTSREDTARWLREASGQERTFFVVELEAGANPIDFTSAELGISDRAWFNVSPDGTAVFQEPDGGLVELHVDVPGAEVHARRLAPLPPHALWAGAGFVAVEPGRPGSAIAIRGWRSLLGSRCEGTEDRPIRP